LVGLDDNLHRADFQRRLVPVTAAAGDPFDGIISPDESRQADGAAPPREDPQLGFRQTDLGPGGHHAIGVRQAVLKATTEGGAIDGRHARDIEIFKVVERGVGLSQPRGHLLVRQLEVLAKLLDIGAGDEYALGAGRKNALETGGGFDRIDYPAQLSQGCRIELVDGFILQIEDNLDDIAVDPFGSDRVTLEQYVVGHEISFFS
jgi:hypothetical protein